MPFDMSGVLGLEGRGACTFGGRIAAALHMQRQEPQTVFTAEMLRKHLKNNNNQKNHLNSSLPPFVNLLVATQSSWGCGMSHLWILLLQDWALVQWLQILESGTFVGEILARVRMKSAEQRQS